MLIFDLKLGKLFALVVVAAIDVDTSAMLGFFYVSDVCFQLKLLRLNFEMESFRATGKKKGAARR